MSALVWPPPALLSPGMRTSWTHPPRDLSYKHPQVTSEGAKRGNLFFCFSAQKEACVPPVGEQVRVTGK